MEIARRKRLPLAEHDVDSWHSAALLTQHEAARLQQYVDILMESELDTDTVFLLWDISQSSEYVGDYRVIRSARFAPTLMRSSKLWWHNVHFPERSRLATKEEYFAIQGVPVGLQSSDSHHGEFPSVIDIEKTTTTDAVHLCGNSMSLRVVGAIFVFLLSTVGKL